MEKIFNDFSVVGAFIGGILSFIFGILFCKVLYFSNTKKLK